MDLNTGMLYDSEEMKQFKDEYIKNNMKEIDYDDMTGKQKKNKQVSLQDHTSILGKQLTSYRSINGLTNNQKRNLRRQLNK